MNHQNKSTPKMRTAFTPRVKSAHSIENNPSKKALYFTNKRNDGNNNINPQKINDHISKKLNLNIQNQKISKKYDIANVNTDTDSPIRRNNFIENNKINNQNKLVNKQKIQGRIHEWHKNDNRFHVVNKDNINKNVKQIQTPTKQKNYRLSKENDQQIQKKSQIKKVPNRCMSAHTFKTTSSMMFTQKSTKIKNQRQQFQQKFNVAFNYLLRSNSQYLKQKLSMCNQKARPKQQIFKIKRPIINTSNVDFYKVVNDKHRLDIQPQNQKMSLLLSNSKVCGNSSTQQIHSGRKGKRADLAQWTQGFKLQGPIYTVTTKDNAYPHHGDFQKMVPIAVWNEHPLGMKHKQNSNNSKFFKGQYGPKAELATWNNLNPLANDLFNPKNNTIYSKQFSKKQKQPIQQWPMAQHKLITTDVKYNTEFTDNIIDFNSHELNHQNRCNCGRKRH